MVRFVDRNVGFLTSLPKMAQVWMEWTPLIMLEYGLCKL